MLTVSTAPDYLLCLRCGFAGWVGMWLEHCPECASPLPGQRAAIIPEPGGRRTPRPKRAQRGKKSGSSRMRHA
jgi:hypothetical protein